MGWECRQEEGCVFLGKSLRVRPLVLSRRRKNGTETDIWKTTYSFLPQKYTTRSIRTVKRNRRKRMKRERSRREKGIKNGVEEFGGITPILFMSLYISVFQETTSFLLGLKGVSASSINAGLRKIMIKRKVIPLSLAQSYLRSYISPQSLPVSHLNNIVSPCESTVNSRKNYEISFLNVVCNKYKLHGYYSKTRT